MKRIYLVLALLALVTLHISAAEKAMLTGKVTEAATGNSLPGVTIYFPDLKVGTVTDINGNYRIMNLPNNKVLIQVQYLNFRTIIESIDLTKTTVKNFALEHTVTELNEVVVTGLSKAGEQKRTPTPISVVPKLLLLQNSSSNIIDAIASQPGVSQITTGTGISKPVIRGLGYNRVVVVNDGIRQEGQQWGDEHGIEVDEYGVGRVEILKGPATLVYGSDAMAGVVNLLPEPPLQDGKIAGNVTTNYQTNNGMIGYSLNLAGNKKGIIWDVRYSNKMAHAYQNRFDGYVFNSGFRENAISGKIGLNKSWGYSHLTMSAYHLQPGMVEGERDSASGKFLKTVINQNGQEDIAIATDKDMKSYHPQMPYQQIYHYKAVWNNNLYLGKGNLAATLGLQQNRRQEFDDILTNQYGLYFHMNTLNYDIKYNFPEISNYNISIGVNGMQQASRNKGTEYLVPEYDLFDAGIYAIAQKALGKVDVSGGVRFDNRHIDSRSLFVNSEGKAISSFESAATERFSAFRKNFGGVSGSLGATWQIAKTLFTKINLSRGFRAPNISELGANGVHEGTFRYEIGNDNLKPENSLQLDYTLGLNTQHISAELNLFDNRINDYIFARKLNNVAGGDSLMDGTTAFKFVSGDAHLYGGEFRFDIHPHPIDWLHIENAFSYVRAMQLHQSDSTRNLPFTPAPKYQLALKAELLKWGKFIRNGYLKLELENYFAQNNVFSAYKTETRTPGYSLLNLGLGTDITNKGLTLFSIYLNA
ncbi:MAG: TonB-dependent receptor, partial [Bacteroidota bacterium]|nr:TonB-dependent receptor [Bacteroidota bacterium]